jgi:hypothetical protein
MTRRRSEGIGCNNGGRIYEGVGSSNSAPVGISNGHEIGSLYEVGDVFGGLSREPHKGVGSSTSGDSDVHHTVVGGDTQRVGKDCGYGQRIGLVEHGGERIDAPEVIGYGNEVSASGDVVEVFGGLVVGPKVGEGCISGDDGKVNASVAVAKTGRLGELYGEGGRNKGLGKDKGVGDNAVVGIGDGNGIGACKQVIKVLGSSGIIPKIGVRSGTASYREVNGSGALRKAIDVLQGSGGSKGKGLKYGISNKSGASVGIGYEHGVVPSGKGVDVLGCSTIRP